MADTKAIQLKVYSIVCQIPVGKVTTYGKVAELARIKSARLVGKVLHQNPNPKKIPCHRVVNAKGKLAKNYAFGGLKAQAQKLKAEGVQVANNRVSFAKYLWQT